MTLYVGPSFNASLRYESFAASDNSALLCTYSSNCSQNDCHCKYGIPVVLAFSFFYSNFLLLSIVIEESPNHYTASANLSDSSSKEAISLVRSVSSVFSSFTYFRRSLRKQTSQSLDWDVYRCRIVIRRLLNDYAEQKEIANITVPRL